MNCSLHFVKVLRGFTKYRCEELIRTRESPRDQWYIRKKWWIFTLPLRGSVNIHHYSPPLR